MFAAAQGKHTYVYNKDGVEVHCLKPHDYTNFLEFLPYHFLLVSHVSNRYTFLTMCRVIELIFFPIKICPQESLWQEYEPSNWVRPCR